MVLACWGDFFVLCMGKKSWIKSEIKLGLGDDFAGVRVQWCSIVKALQAWQQSCRFTAVEPDVYGAGKTLLKGRSTDERCSYSAKSGTIRQCLSKHCVPLSCPWVDRSTTVFVSTRTTIVQTSEHQIHFRICIIMLMVRGRTLTWWSLITALTRITFITKVWWRSGFSQYLWPVAVCQVIAN